MHTIIKSTHCSTSLLWYFTMLSIQSMNSSRLPSLLHGCVWFACVCMCNCPFHQPLLVIKQRGSLHAEDGNGRLRWASTQPQPHTVSYVDY